MTLTLTEAAKRWMTFRGRCVSLGMVAASTHDNQLQIVGTAISPHLGAFSLGGLRKSDIDLWVGERLQTHAPVTVQGELNVLRQILNWCVDEQILGARPRLPTVQVPAVEGSLPSDGAYLWALKAVPDHHRAALELMMLTGLSPHEAERLQVRDYACDRQALGIGQRPDFKVKTPSRRRWVPLNARAQQLWKRITADKRPLDAALPSGCAMQKALARARSADPDAPADTRRVTPKLMRQWFASKVSGATGDDATPEHILQRLMGHSPGSKITRKHYVRSSDEAMVGAVGRLRA